ncbi:MAG TPA: hypothetical protein VGR54_08995 [Nitrosopumilaceae archaeon]|nr:hypothetical protein [Nitrosopumilaceae archaeon]
MRISSLVVVFVFLLLIVSIIPRQVSGDGFTQETLPPVNVGNRTVSLFVKINPLIITPEINQDRYLKLRWFDANTNQTIQHASFMVEVVKNNQPILRGIFHTHTGILTLKVTPSNDPKSWTIHGLRQQFLDGYIYSPLNNDSIDLVAPMLGEGGLYHIYAILITMDNDQNFFQPQDSPKFDSFLSVGDLSNHTITYKNNSYNAQIVSYYDRISDFNFKPSSLKFSWYMPFDWNTTRFQNLPILVHQELRIPKLFKEYSGSQTFTGTVNNDSIKEGKVIVDPYSFQDKTVIHLILNKNDIEDFMKHTPLQANEMNFTISPSGSVVIPSTIANNASVPEFGSSVGAAAVIGIICVIVTCRILFQVKTRIL